MCADAGLTHVFIGIETPNEESLREVKKRQNLKKNLVEEIQRFVDFGISVDCGMIVGFDGDDASIFERQYNFAMASPVPIFSLGTLVAPDATPLHARLAKEGRLFEIRLSRRPRPWHSNIVPKQMTREQVVEGVKWLCNSLYRPEAFEERVARVIETFGSRRRSERPRPTSSGEMRAINADVATLIRRIAQLGPAEKKMLANVVRMFRQNPAAAPYVMGNLFQYAQARYMYEFGQFWEPMLPAAAAAPVLPQRHPSGLRSRPDADTRIARGSLSQPPDALQQLRVPARLSSRGAHHLCARRPVSARRGCRCCSRCRSCSTATGTCASCRCWSRRSW